MTINWILMFSLPPAVWNVFLCSQALQEDVGLAKLVDIFCTEGYNAKANLHYLGPLLSNLTQLPEARHTLMDRDRWEKPTGATLFYYYIVVVSYKNQERDFCFHSNGGGSKHLCLHQTVGVQLCNYKGLRFWTCWSTRLSFYWVRA